MNALYLYAGMKLFETGADGDSFSSGSEHTPVSYLADMMAYWSFPMQMSRVT